MWQWEKHSTMVGMMSCDIIVCNVMSHAPPTWVDKPVQRLHNACLNAVLGQGHLHRLVLEVLRVGGERRRGKGGRGGEGRKGGEERVRRMQIMQS